MNVVNEWFDAARELTFSLCRDRLMLLLVSSWTASEIACVLIANAVNHIVRVTVCCYVVLY